MLKLKPDYPRFKGETNYYELNYVEHASEMDSKVLGSILKEESEAGKNVPAAASQPTSLEQKKKAARRLVREPEID
ncbi:hypothetical protein FRX31_012711 [Thalictrum thalictroides]|uniref:Uncharacterized protein n=1 Tax=Thalictrum thalictroides TaxID=46969 RepID=A0A7J6WK15_THATH|nr:hypothetical protein FRX31_012711 [Thalictrum thalictroides]